jgi:hypothetical protein
MSDTRGSHLFVCGESIENQRCGDVLIRRWSLYLVGLDLMTCDEIFRYRKLSCYDACELVCVFVCVSKKTDWKFRE